MDSLILHILIYIDHVTGNGADGQRAANKWVMISHAMGAIRALSCAVLHEITWLPKIMI